MNNRSIAWWLRQIGFPQYTKTLERQYYGLEGLLYLTEGDLKEAGVEDPEHRETILAQLTRHQQRLQPTASKTTTTGDGAVTPSHRVTRKYSLGSSLDLMKPSRRLSGHTVDLFRQSILPRLRRRDRVTLSSSCSQLSPLQEALVPPLPGPDLHHPPQPPACAHKEQHRVWLDEDHGTSEVEMEESEGPQKTQTSSKPFKRGDYTDVVLDIFGGENSQALHRIPGVIGRGESKVAGGSKPIPSNADESFILDLTPVTEEEAGSSLEEPVVIATGAQKKGLKHSSPKKVMMPMDPFLNVKQNE